MTTETVSSTYEQIATDITRAARLIEVLDQELARARSIFAKDEALTEVGQKVTTLYETEMASLNQALEGFSHLLQTKLDEPLDDKLGLGSWQQLEATA
jgi:hypothetical protein